MFPGVDKGSAGGLLIGPGSGKQFVKLLSATRHIYLTELRKTNIKPADRVNGMAKIIAVGNRLMRDDGVAIAVVEHIGHRLRNPGCEVIIGETDFEMCFHLLHADDFIIILDAAYTGGAPGSIHVFSLRDAAGKGGKNRFQHELSIFALMSLYAKPLRGYLIGIEIAEIGVGCELSKPLTSKFDDICRKVEQTIKKLAGEAHEG